MTKSSISASISVTGAEIAKIVLMPGDPLRAKHVAERYLENPVCFNTVRNMLGYTGIYKGRQVSVMGHGMGVPSMGIYATELYTQFGVESIIRIGSAGGLCEQVKLRDVIIAMAASTNSNYGAAFAFPGIFTPVASYEMLADAVEALFAAIYLDGGIEEVRSVIWQVLLSKAPAAEERRDYKTTLQEVVQRKSGQVLTYHMLSQSGPDHDKTFLFDVRLNGASIGQGEGRSKKEAEQAAARDALERMSR